MGKKERNEIEKVLITKSPLTSNEIIKAIKKLPKSTIKNEYGKGKPNPEYIREFSKYIQTNLYDGYDKKRLTLCKEGRVFRLSEKDFLEHKKDKIKISAKQFMGYYGGWKKGDKSYYFAIPKTYFIKIKIFNEIIRDIFLKNQEISKYLDHKEKIEELLKDAEKFMMWVEISPNVKDGYEGSESSNFTQYIINFICKGKEMFGALNCISDDFLAPTLEKIENLLSIENFDTSYINFYRILIRELYERRIFRLPKKYLKNKKEFYKDESEERREGIIDSKFFQKYIQDKGFRKNVDKILSTKST